jgi:hypothetical protein
MWRQGDVLIRPIPAIPKTVQPKAPDRGRAILAYGEVTGHAHALDATLAELFEHRDGTLYLRVTGPGAAVTHEEHAAIPLAPGTYQITHQREYTPTEIRRVAD